MNLRIRLVLFFILFFLCGVEKGFGQGKISRPTQQSQTIKPNKHSTKITVSDSDGYINGHGYVDLGLPSGTKWATCNIGAKSPFVNGDYFAWGEISVKSNYTTNNSLAYGRAKSKLQQDGIINTLGTLNSSNDAASAIWGGIWRMPTSVECEELLNECKWERTILEGKRGYRVSGPNGKSIFLPEAGYRIGSDLNNDGMAGYIWCSTVNDNQERGINLHFDKYSHGIYDGISDYARGLSIRPVH